MYIYILICVSRVLSYPIYIILQQKQMMNNLRVQSHHSSQYIKQYIHSKIKTDTSSNYMPNQSLYDNFFQYQKKYNQIPAKQDKYSQQWMINDNNRTDQWVFNIKKQRNNISQKQITSLFEQMRIITFLDEQSQLKQKYIIDKKKYVNDLQNEVEQIEFRIKNQNSLYFKKFTQMRGKRIKQKSKQKMNSNLLTEKTLQMQSQIKNMFRIIKNKGLTECLRLKSDNKNDNKIMKDKRQIYRNKKVRYVPIYNHPYQIQQNYPMVHIPDYHLQPWKSQFLINQNQNNSYQLHNNINPQQYKHHSYHLQQNNNYPYRFHHNTRQNYLSYPITRYQNNQHQAEITQLKNTYQSLDLDKRKSTDQKPRQSFKKTSLKKQSANRDNIQNPFQVLTKNFNKKPQKQQNLDYFYQNQQQQPYQNFTNVQSTIKKSKQLKNQPYESQNRQNKAQNSSQMAESIVQSIYIPEQKKRTPKNYSGNQQIFKINIQNMDRSYGNKTTMSQQKRFEMVQSDSNSKQARINKIQQSKVNINLNDLGYSKSSQSNSNKSSQGPNNYLPQLIQEIHQIDQEEETLKNTPNSPRKQLQISQSQNIANYKNQNIKLPLSTEIKPQLQKQEEEQDDCINSIRLQTQSKFSRSLKLNLDPQAQEDILDGITLLRESKISRNSMLLKSKIEANSLIFDEEAIKKSKSQIKDKKLTKSTFVLNKTNNLIQSEDNRNNPNSSNKVKVYQSISNQNYKISKSEKRNPYNIQQVVDEQSQQSPHSKIQLQNS